MLTNFYVTLRALLTARDDSERGITTVEFMAITAGVIVIALAVVAAVTGRVNEWIDNFNNA